MYVVEFVRDISRFHKHGLLWRFCALLFMRVEVAVCCGVVIAIFLFVGSPRDKILTVILALAVATWIFMMFTIQFLSPLYFGTFLIARLKTKARPAAVLASFYDQLEVLPCGAELYVTYFGKHSNAGKVGQLYPLLRHPQDQEVALAIIDDDPKYMSRLKRYASDERWAQILEQLNALGRSFPENAESGDQSTGA